MGAMDLKMGIYIRLTCFNLFGECRLQLWSIRWPERNIVTQEHVGFLRVETSKLNSSSTCGINPLWCFMFSLSAFLSVEGVSQSPSTVVNLASPSAAHAGTCTTWTSENQLDSPKTRTLGEETILLLYFPVFIFLPSMRDCFRRGGPVPFFRAWGFGHKVYKLHSHSAAILITSLVAAVEVISFQVSWKALTH